MLAHHGGRPFVTGLFSWDDSGRLQSMRIAWFSPLPPVRSGIAAYSAELLPRLRAPLAVDAYPEAAAHDFVWRHRREPYTLVVYQLGNAPCHDYMWAYLARYPGLVVLHDARLHHARARSLLARQRFDDYRREFAFDQPDAGPGVAEYAIQGLGGAISYFWPMLRVVMATARSVATHSERVAADLRDEYPGTPVDVVRMGVPPLASAPGAGEAVRRALGIGGRAFLFAAFGKVTAEKRIAPILQALGALAAEGRDVHLLLVGDAEGYPSLASELADHGVAGRVRVTGHVDEGAIAAHLEAADACLCLRWPTALESSASWLRCLAARRATVITDLAHLADVPADAALRVDVIEEEASLLDAMRRLADEDGLRAAVAAAGHAFWAADHTLEAMADDYARLLRLAASRPAPAQANLPEHFLDDHSGLARAIARDMGVSPDVLIS